MAFVIDPSGGLHEKHIYKQDTGATYLYAGTADPSSLTSASVWSVSRETIATGEILQAAGGVFTQIWDNRAALVYA